MQIAIPLFDRFTALDAAGPYAVLVRLTDVEVVYVAAERGLVHDDGVMQVPVEATFDDVLRPDVVVVPGGFPTRLLARVGDPIVDWIAAVHPTTTWTTSVCTGALLLGAAGVLDGLTATTNWTAYEDLAELGAVPVPERYVVHPDERVITSAGVSAGIDMALVLAARLRGEREAMRVQLGLEYDPQPPFRAGTPTTAPAEIVEEMRARVAAGKARLLAGLHRA